MKNFRDFSRLGEREIYLIHYLEQKHAVAEPFRWCLQESGFPELILQGYSVTWVPLWLSSFLHLCLFSHAAIYGSEVFFPAKPAETSPLSLKGSLLIFSGIHPRSKPSFRLWFWIFSIFFFILRFFFLCFSGRRLGLKGKQSSNGVSSSDTDEISGIEIRVWYCWLCHYHN